MSLQQSWNLLDVAKAPDAVADDHILTLYNNALNDLQSGDYSLQLFLPDDDTDITVRTQALSQWTQGFLIGFGAAGIDPQAQFSSDNAEALRDLAQITQATVTGDVSNSDSELIHEDNEQEADYLELTEYIRIVALTFYAEYNTEDIEETPKNLH